MSAVRKAARTAFRLTRPVVREWPLQKQIADALKLEIAPPGRVSPAGVVWFSIDFADFGGVAGARVGRGVVAGPPDIIVLYRGLAHWVEVKPEDGQLSDAQRSVCAALLVAGCSYAVARDANDVLNALDIWNIPRPGRVRITA